MILQKLAALLRIFGSYGAKAFNLLVRLADRISPRASKAEFARQILKLEKLAPKFLVYFDTSPDGTYQMQMWLPEFEKISEQYAFVVRRPDLQEALKKLTERPVLLAREMEDLDLVAANPSIRAVFYVNNNPKNIFFILIKKILIIAYFLKRCSASPLYSEYYLI